MVSAKESGYSGRARRISVRDAYWRTGRPECAGSHTSVRPRRAVVRLFTACSAAAAFILFVGIIVSRVLARSVLISAVNMQIQSARLLGLGVKWLVIVLTLAMVLDHLKGWAE